MEDRYRKSEGQDQLEMWPEEAPKNNGWLIAGVLALMIVLVFIAPYLVQ